METPLDQAPPPPEDATFGAGCFWCVEAVFNQIRGVLRVESGYCNGSHPSPTYEAVCTGRTGHAEVVKVHFEPDIVSYEQLLAVFFSIHDPTTLNRQGADTGTQYRSGIYVFTPEQRRAAERSRDAYQAKLKAAGYDAITTEIMDAPDFYFAEGYHQQYLAKNPMGYCGLGGTGVSCPIGTPVAA